MRAPAAILVPLLLLAASGCGQSEDRDQVRAVTERFYAALAAGDGAAACDQLTPAAAAALAEQARAPCADAIARLELPAAAVARVRVFVTTAQVRLRGGETAYLDRDPDGWRLAAVGCRFEDGKPRDRPATCEANA